LKLALLKGNRFNPWHLEPFARLRDVKVTAFRAESEIQRHFAGRGEQPGMFTTERIYFDDEAYAPWAVAKRWWRARFGGEAKVRPFYDRLEGFDVIQTWELFTDWSEQAMEAKARYGAPVSVMVWDTIPFNNEQTERRRAIKQRVLNEADVFIVHTERSRRMLLMEGADEGRIRMIAPGVDTNRFQPRHVDRQALGMEDEEYVILFVGWFLERKGLDYLVLALHELSKEVSWPLHLYMVGSGPGQERIEHLLKRADVQYRYTFAGSLPYSRMADVYCASDVFVLPSVAVPGWQEQFGMSLIEAMACGRPVVASMSGAIPEIAGDNVRLVQPNDFMAIEQALEELLGNTKNATKLGVQARGYAADRFDVNKTAAALNAVYAELA